MKTLLIILAMVSSTLLQAEGYGIGDKAEDFRLKNIDGNMVSLADYKDAKGFIVVFTCNECPYAIAYQDRIIALDKKYQALGYPVIAINPNDPEVQPADSYERMQERAKEKEFTFPYLYDADQSTYPKFGATRTPHIFLLNKENGDLVVRYIGTIDDNYANASAVKKTYLANAVDALLAGKTPNPSTTKAIGCSIKKK
jgi:peroxiredoxin